VSHYHSLTLSSLCIVVPSQFRTAVPSHCLPLALLFLASFCRIFTAFSQILRFLSSCILDLLSFSRILILLSFSQILVLSDSRSLRFSSSQILVLSDSRHSSRRLVIFVILLQCSLTFSSSCHPLGFSSSRPLVLLFLASFCPIVFLLHCRSLRAFSQILRFSSSCTAVLIYFTYSCHLCCNRYFPFIAVLTPGHFQWVIVIC
jgi:hypothetical protein